MKNEKKASKHSEKAIHGSSCRSEHTNSSNGAPKSSDPKKNCSSSSHTSPRDEMSCSNEFWPDLSNGNTKHSYRELNLSLSRMINGEQTDIRIHRETGHPTDIYVSQGGESWSLEPSELDQLPEELRDEVEMLLTPPEEGRSNSWITFLVHEQSHGNEEEEYEKENEEECALSGCGCR